MSPEYSIRADRDCIDRNIELGYSRARDNFTRAVSLAQNTPWLWGEHASFSDYEATNPAAHQLTGELPLGVPGYRTEEYNRCNDSVSKELLASFTEDVYERGASYLDKALDANTDRVERVIALDFAKQYLLTMFHAVQYPMRTKAVDAGKMAIIDRLAESARSATRAFYLDVLGHDDEWILSETERAKSIFADPTVHAAIKEADKAHFKAQEMDQPLTVLAASLLAANDHPDTELIYGLPAGGTQHAIVTQLLFELKSGGKHIPRLDYLTISTHSTGKNALHGKVSPSVETVIGRSNPRGKNVLVCEDNSNTGTTLSLASDIITALGPKGLHVSIAEFDPRRLEVKNQHPQPLAQIANYEHPDFTTAVGVVPVTTGTYPDIQMRKLTMLRRKVSQLLQHEEMDTRKLDYELIPEDFYGDFYRTYKNVLRYCGDTYGYRSPHLVSAVLVRHYAERGMIDAGDFDDSSRTVLQIARAATLYPHLPDHVQSILQSGAESLDYRPDGPWVRTGARALIKSLLDYSEDADSSVTLWTKGDGGTTANPPHIGLNEQAIRYRLSGLERSLGAIGFGHSSRSSFVAHPKKTHLLKTKVLPDILRKNQAIEDIVIIDDSEKNLAEAAQFIRLFGLRPHVINPLDYETKRADLPNIRELAQRRVWGNNVAFIVDMDDTLLHERFRKHHQPRNIALALISRHPEILYHKSQDQTL